MFDNVPNFPIRHIVVLVTEECNLRCSYCYIRKRPRTMREETADKTVDFLFDNAPEEKSPVSVTFFGGEPLLEPGLIERIHERASKRAEKEGRDISFSMTSNATLLTEKNTQLIERLGINLRVSLDGIEESHDLHRKTISGRGSFRLIKKQMSRLKRLKRVSVRLTVSPETAAELPHSVRWLNENGFRNVSFSEVTEAEWDEASLADLYKAREELLRMKQAEQSKENPHKDYSLELLQTCGSRWGCGAARSFVAVDTAGHLYPCHRFIGYFRNGKEQRIGHVKDGLFPEKREKYVLANHSTGRQGCGSGLFDDKTAEKDKKCNSCKLLQVCGSNCIAVNDYMTGDPSKPHPVNRILAQIEATTSLNAMRREQEHLSQ